MEIRHVNPVRNSRTRLHDAASDALWHWCGGGIGDSFGRGRNAINAVDRWRIRCRCRAALVVAGSPPESPVLAPWTQERRG